MTLSQELISLLACPKCRGDLQLLGTLERAEGFSCAGCDVVYPVYDDIPVLLTEKAFPRRAWDAGERG